MSTAAAAVAGAPLAAPTALVLCGMTVRVHSVVKGEPAVAVRDLALAAGADDSAAKELVKACRLHGAPTFMADDQAPPSAHNKMLFSWLDAGAIVKLMSQALRAKVLEASAPAAPAAATPAALPPDAEGRKRKLMELVNTFEKRQRVPTLAAAAKDLGVEKELFSKLTPAHRKPADQLVERELTRRAESLYEQITRTLRLDEDLPTLFAALFKPRPHLLAAAVRDLPLVLQNEFLAAVRSQGAQAVLCRLQAATLERVGRRAYEDIFRQGSRMLDELLPGKLDLFPPVARVDRLGGFKVEDLPEIKTLWLNQRNQACAYINPKEVLEKFFRLPGARPLVRGKCLLLVCNVDGATLGTRGSTTFTSTTMHVLNFLDLEQSVKTCWTINVYNGGESYEDLQELVADLTIVQLRKLEEEGFSVLGDGGEERHVHVKVLWCVNGKTVRIVLGRGSASSTHPCPRCPVPKDELADFSKVRNVSVTAARTNEAATAFAPGGSMAARKDNPENRRKLGASTGGDQQFNLLGIDALDVMVQVLHYALRGSGKLFTVAVALARRYGIEELFLSACKAGGLRLSQVTHEPSGVASVTLRGEDIWVLQKIWDKLFATFSGDNADIGAALLEAARNWTASLAYLLSGDTTVTDAGEACLIGHAAGIVVTEVLGETSVTPTFHEALMHGHEYIHRCGELSKEVGFPVCPAMVAEFVAEQAHYCRAQTYAQKTSRGGGKGTKEENQMALVGRIMFVEWLERMTDEMTPGRSLLSRAKVAKARRKKRVAKAYGAPPPAPPPPAPPPPAPPPAPGPAAPPAPPPATEVVAALSLLGTAVAARLARHPPAPGEALAAARAAADFLDEESELASAPGAGMETDLPDEADVGGAAAASGSGSDAGAEHDAGAAPMSLDDDDEEEEDDDAEAGGGSGGAAAGDDSEEEGLADMLLGPGAEIDKEEEVKKAMLDAAVGYDDLDDTHVNKKIVKVTVSGLACDTWRPKATKDSFECSLRYVPPGSRRTEMLTVDVKDRGEGKRMEVAWSSVEAIHHAADDDVDTLTLDLLQKPVFRLETKRQTAKRILSTWTHPVTDWTPAAVVTKVSRRITLVGGPGAFDAVVSTIKELSGAKLLPKLREATPPARTDTAWTAPVCSKLLGRQAGVEPVCSHPTLVLQFAREAMRIPERILAPQPGDEDPMARCARLYAARSGMLKELGELQTSLHATIANTEARLAGPAAEAAQGAVAVAKAMQEDSD